MQLPSIAIINFSNIDDQEVQNAIRAVNRQITEDFLPIWGCGRILKLYEASFMPTTNPITDEEADDISEEKVQADSVLYLVNESTLPGALGYHSINTSELPIGFVFTEPGDWTITLSHEGMELIVDPTVNIFLPGPDPRDFDNPNKWLFHSYEVCDAVERTSYQIDGVEVSNFVTPHYFSAGDAFGTRNDFLGTGVRSFDLLEGCHLGVVDPFSYNFLTIRAQQQRTLPNLKRFQDRLGTFSRSLENAKPPRPGDNKLNSILSSYKNKPLPNSKPLQLPAITRSGRYQAKANQMKQMQK